ncbi:MAG: LuxR family transcriptional regulator [Pseudomonadota bacterium]
MTLDYGRIAFDFIDHLLPVSRPDDILDRFHAAIAHFGYTTFIFTGLPNLTERFEQKVLLKHWPEEWFQTYTREQYILDDPVGWFCRSAAEPFEWSEARYDPDKQPRSHQVMNAASEFGMRRGLCVPVHGLLGLDWCVSLGGDKLDLSPLAKASVHLMAVYAFNKARRAPALLAMAPFPRLTAREREVIAWTAAGKSAWETSCILGIAVDTVNKHAASAARKLNATNKTQAVAEAIRRHEIPW